MKHTIIWLFFTLSLVLISCGSDATQKGSSQIMDENTGIGLRNDSMTNRSITQIESQPLVSDNWTIISGKKVGLVDADANEQELIDTYGEQQVARRGIGVGERQTVQASVVFPDQADELIVIWQQDAPFERIAEVRVQNDSSRWHSLQGIKIGTTLQELEKINGRSFDLYGFEWDYAGLVNDWNGGLISPDLQVYLIAKYPEEVLPDLLGEAKFSSTMSKAQSAGLYVGSMVFVFDEEGGVQ